jgi:hypothetical protein
MLLIFCLLIQILHLTEGAAERLVACNKDVISIPYPLKDINWDKGMNMIKEGKINEAQDLRNKAFYRYPFKVENNNTLKLKTMLLK